MAAKTVPGSKPALRRRLIGALSATLVVACSPDDALQPGVNPSGTTPVQLAIGNAAPFSNRFAYAWADQPNNPSYTANPSFSFIGTGGGIRITGTGGSYAVTFGGLSRAGVGGTETFIVTPYGSNRAHCVAGFYTDTGVSIVVNVFCFDAILTTTTPSAFTILAVGSNSLPARSAFAYANNPIAAHYTPDPNFSYSSTVGATLAITHDSLPGNYRVNLGTGNPAGSAFLVNSQLSANLCEIGEWKPVTARIRCFDAGSGIPFDADYQVLQLGAGRPGMRFGFAFADQSTAASYTPNTSRSHSTGGSIKATRSAVGHYAVTFTGLQKLAGHTETVQLTPFATAYVNCNVISWTSLASALKANVECRNLAGNFRDSRFEIVVIE